MRELSPLSKSTVAVCCTLVCLTVSFAALTLILQSLCVIGYLLLLCVHSVDIRSTSFHLNRTVLSRDLRYATLYWILKPPEGANVVSYTEDAAIRGAVQRTITRCIKTIRFHVARDINLKYCPEIKFQ